MTTEKKVEEERLNFTIVREDWSTYRLKDTGSLVKFKVSMSDLIDTGRRKGKAPELNFTSNTVFFKEPSPDDKGEPSDSSKIEEGDIIQDLQFEKIFEPVNIYDVPEKFILLVKQRLKDIKKTKKFDLKGNRIYQSGVECDINIVNYPK